MPGLLDTFLAPENSQANQSLFGRMIQGNLGQGLIERASILAAQNSPEAKMRMRAQEMQLQQAQMAIDKAKRDEAMDLQMQGAAQQAYRTPEQANAMSMGPMPDGGVVAPVAPGFDQKQFLGSLYGINPMKAMQIEQSMAKETPFNKIDPKDYTQQSVAKFAMTRNPADLVAARKLDVVNGQAVDLYNTAPGTVFDNIDPNKPFNLKGGQAVPNVGFQNYEIGKALAGASNVSVNTGQKGLDNEMKFSAAFKGEPIYKAHQEVQSAHSQITQALKQNSPAGDLAGATKLMKILDPGSVVRESELGMAMAATGAMDRLTNLANMVVTGQKLTPSQRKDFQTLADNLASESVKQYNAKRTEYHGFAGKYGLDSDVLLGKPAAGVGAAPTPAAPAFDSLPKNASPYKGKVATDTVTGKKYRSNGLSWEEVK